MEVRPLSASHEASYLALRIKSIEELPELTTPEILRELNMASVGPGGLLTTYGQGRQCVWGAFDNDSLVGMIAATLNASRQDYRDVQLWGLYVTPRFRGTPASQGLLASALEWCRRQPGKVTVSVWVPKTNLRALRFFDRHYFRLADNTTKQSIPLSTAQDIVVMEYFLGD